MVISACDRSSWRRTKRLRSIPSVVVVLGSVMGLGPAMAADSGPGQRPRLPVPVTNASPVIDGKLDEPCWQGAAKTAPLTVISGTPGKSATEALILRDADHLYVGLRCAGRPGRNQSGAAAPGKN